MNKDCHDPTCDHSTCQKEDLVSMVETAIEFCKDKSIVLPAGVLIFLGFVRGELSFIVGGLALLGVSYEIHKIKKMIKNIGPWY